MMSAINFILIGAIAAVSAVIALFFVRYWRSTGDRFFLYFALAFLLEGGNRLFLGAYNYGEEFQPEFYLLRLVAYGLILYAIYQKNRRPKG
jgi:hypothetical protein